ncbi:MAG: amidohydrolase family protein [Thermodesulfobacteriota bacterium]
MKINRPLMFLAVTALVLCLGACVPAGSAPARKDMAGRGPATSALFIDTHVHLDDVKLARFALDEMAEFGVGKMILMPTPAAADRYNTGDLDAAAAAARKYPDRFAFLGGGGTLNALIHQAAEDPAPSAELMSRFEQRAARIMEMGALGFGEMAARHLSLRPDHPYISAPPDHPLFLKLADLAAGYGVPLDLHLEAVVREVELPGRLGLPPNPEVQTTTIPALERLLEHNRRAVIIWSHLGWDNTGQRSVELTRVLLKKHPNLYMNFKLRREGPQVNSPLNPDLTIKSEWLELIREFPDRFLLGSDAKYIRAAQRHGGKTNDVKETMVLLETLPQDLAAKIGYENARRIFKLR